MAGTTNKILNLLISYLLVMDSRGYTIDIYRSRVREIVRYTDITIVV